MNITLTCLVLTMKCKWGGWVSYLGATTQTHVSLFSYGKRGVRLEWIHGVQLLDSSVSISLGALKSNKQIHMQVFGSLFLNS